MAKIGLVLTAGGARGAYQAGVLKKISELKVKKKKFPFQILTGASAGALNAAYCAAGASDFNRMTDDLIGFWSKLKTKNVYSTNMVELTRRAMTWVKDLSLGGFMGGGNAQSLLDSRPLHEFLKTHLPFDKIKAQIDKQSVDALAITATSYHSGKSITFIQSAFPPKHWNKSRKLSVSTPIQLEHVCASAAIPVLFPPVLVDSPVEKAYFGDGALRLTAPLSPAIRLGAEKIFAIGIRSQRTRPANDQEDAALAEKQPALAQVLGVILNSIFLDHLDTDLEHLNRMNELVSFIPNSERVLPKGMSEPMKRVDCLVLHPSVNVSEIAEAHARHVPRMIRYLLEGLGTSKAESADLMSYLLFDSHFTQALVQVGYRDAYQRKDEIEAFLND